MTLEYYIKVGHRMLDDQLNHIFRVVHGKMGTGKKGTGKKGTGKKGAEKRAQEK